VVGALVVALVQSFPSTTPILSLYYVSPIDKDEGLVSSLHKLLLYLISTMFFCLPRYG
jgi:hypothetical protein